MIWCGIVLCGLYGAVWIYCGMVWYGMVWCMVWYGITVHV